MRHVLKVAVVDDQSIQPEYLKVDVSSVSKCQHIFTRHPSNSFLDSHSFIILLIASCITPIQNLSTFYHVSFILRFNIVFCVGILIQFGFSFWLFPIHLAFATDWWVETPIVIARHKPFKPVICNNSRKHGKPWYFKTSKHTVHWSHGEPVRIR